MYRGSSIEFNALGESWRCRKCQKIGYCMFGSRQGIPGRDKGFLVATRDSWSQQSTRNAKNMLRLVLGRDKGFLVVIEFFSGSVSRQEFLCRDMVLIF